MYTAIPTRRMVNTLSPYMGIGAMDPLSMGISAGVSLASGLLASWLASKKQVGAAKVYTTTIVNELEPLLRKNTDAYLAGPGSCMDQTAALTAFDSALAWLQTPQACGNLQLGTPGQNCINDRLPGGQWDWTAMYRDPIASDSRPQCGYAANASGQAAVQNIMNKISGSNVQTNAGQYLTASGDVGGGLLSGSLNIGGMAIPTEYLVLGGAALVLVMVAT